MLVVYLVRNSHWIIVYVVCMQELLLGLDGLVQ